MSAELMPVGWVEWWLLLATLAATVAVWSFVLHFARVPFERSATGRAIMATAVAVGVMTIGALLRRLDAPQVLADVVIAAGWTLVAAAMAWKTRQLRKAQQGRPHSELIPDQRHRAIRCRPRWRR